MTVVAAAVMQGIRLLRQLCGILVAIALISLSQLLLDAGSWVRAVERKVFATARGLFFLAELVYRRHGGRPR